MAGPRRRPAVTELSSGFGSCPDPAALQAVCDRFGRQHVQEWSGRWMDVIPLPLTDADREAGLWWELPMRQTGTSRRLVFDAGVHARAFFESLLCENMDLGRPGDEASCNLARLSRIGLSAREPGRNRYRLTHDGLLFSAFYTRVCDHVLRPLMAPGRPSAPPGITVALDTPDQLIAAHHPGARPHRRLSPAVTGSIPVPPNTVAPARPHHR